MIMNNLEACICLQVPNTDCFVIASARKERAAARKREAVDCAGMSFKLGCETILLNGCQRVIGASGRYLHSLQGLLHQKFWIIVFNTVAAAFSHCLTPSSV